MIRPSTRAFFREGRSNHQSSLFDLIHGYVYARWPYFYIGTALGERPRARLALFVFNLLAKLLGLRQKKGRGGKGHTFADTYHGKVMPLGAASRLINVNRDIEIRNMEMVIPYTLATDIVLKNPDHIAVLQCPCRSSRKHPCSPLDVCLIVGEPFASFMLEHHPERARRITQAEAVEILREEEERGHVHHAFFKDAMLGRYYAICNCCKCCCGAMQAHRHGIPMLASSGYVAAVDHSLCVACGTCAKYCQFEAVHLVNGVKTIDEAQCMGCGVCVTKCTKKAVKLVRDEGRGEPLTIDGSQ